MLNFLNQTITLYTGGFGKDLNWLGKLIQWIVELGLGIGGAWVGIIIFTVALRTLLLPLDAYSKATMRKNSLKMEKMRPQLEKLQKQYKNDQQAYNRKMMELYKKNGYSMLGACLPVLVTMVVFIIVLTSFSAYSDYAKVQVYEKMADSYSEAVLDYTAEESTFSEWTLQEDGTYARIETRDSADALINATITWTLIAGEDNSQEALNARAEAGEATVSKETYTVKTDSVFAAIDGGDETLIAAKAQVDARDASVSSNRDLYAATIVLQVGSNAAAARYEEAKDSFLWVKNIWLSDTSYSHPINLEDGVPEAAYEQLTLELGAQKTEANGYYILIIISIGTMFLSQFILSKSNKAQNELQTADGRGKKTQRVMMIVMPIIFGIFSFMYSAGFTIYMIVGNVYNILSSLTINFIIDKKFRKNEEREIREKYNKRIPQSARDGGKKV